MVDNSVVYGQVQPVVDTGFNLTWQLTIVIVAVIGFISLLFYIESRRKIDSKEDKRFMNPLFKTIIITLILAVILLILEAFNVIQEGWVREHWWVFALFMMGVWYYFNKDMAKLRPMKMEKLEFKAWELIYRRAKARPHRGVGFGSPMPYHNVIKLSNKDKDGDKNPYNKVVNFLARTNHFGGMFIFVTLDIGNAYEVAYIENPDSEYVRSRFGKEVAQQYDIERDLLRKSIEPDEYRVESNSYDEQNKAQASAY